METVHINDLKGMLTEAKMEIDLVLDAFANKIVIGEISRPLDKKPRAKRVYRKKKDPAPFPEKREENLPDADKDHPFYSDKPKRGRKPKKEESADQPSETSILVSSGNLNRHPFGLVDRKDVIKSKNEGG